MKITEIKAGDTFVCTKDVFMQTDNEHAYIKGKTYVSEDNGCITDEQGSAGHEWGCDSDFGAEETNEHFEKIEPSVVAEMKNIQTILLDSEVAKQEGLYKQFERIGRGEQTIDVEYQEVKTPIYTPTPGPWYAVNYAGYINLQTEDKYTGINLLDMDKCASAEANGRLAAAAPTLLTLLSKFVSFAKAGYDKEDIDDMRVEAEALVRYVANVNHVCNYMRKPYTYNYVCVECGKERGNG